MKNEAASLNELQGAISAAGWSAAEQTLNDPRAQILCGWEQVRYAQGMLVQLSRRTGQLGATDWLDHFLASPDSRAKTPYLVLISNPVTPPKAFDPAYGLAEDLAGAVLLYEYRFAGCGTRVFATDDMIGIRTVIAPKERRVEVAHLAIRALMQTGAIMALISLDSAMAALGRRATADVVAYRLQIRQRRTPRYLALHATLDRTLTSLGKHTRRNLRYYRRKAELELGLAFVPCVQMKRSEFLDVDRNSMNPTPEEVANWRFDLIEQRLNSPNVLFCGLQAADGSWVSLAGGRRNDRTTEIDWQVNLTGFPRYSLCTVMRSYIIENEIARGAERLVFEGGTSHPMRFGFTEEETTDLLAVRRLSVRAWILKTLSRWIFPQKNFLGAALRHFHTEVPRPSQEHPASPDELADAA